MKKKVNRYTQQIEVGTQDGDNVLMDFSRLLDCQVIFYIIKDTPLYMTSPEEAQKPMISYIDIIWDYFFISSMSVHLNSLFLNLHSCIFSCSHSVLLSTRLRFSVSHLSLGKYAELHFFYNDYPNYEYREKGRIFP